MGEKAAIPGWPAVLRRELAATYCGLSVNTFDTEVKASRAPGPVQMTRGVKGWRRSDLEAWIEGMKLAHERHNPWDDA